MFNYNRINKEMHRNSYSILFYFRKSKRDPEKGAIYTRLTLNGEKIELCHSGVHCYYSDFDSKRQKVKNQDLNTKLLRLTNDIIYYIESIPNPTTLKVKNLVLSRESLNPSLLQVLKMYLEENQHLYATGTKKDWTSKIGTLECYLTEQKNTNLEARQFSTIEFERFKTWLMKARKCGENHANKHGQKFRKALRWAVRKGHIQDNPLRDVDLPIEDELDLTHLEWHWVEKLRNYNFTGKYKKAVDMFVFSCCTGICYADMVKLETKNLKYREDLGTYIQSKRQKTKTPYSTPLYAFAAEILQEHRTLENIPKISNQKANEYIKLALLRINYTADDHTAEDVTFHTARKTFISHCLNDIEGPDGTKGLAPHIVITYSGHSSVDEIKRYAKVKEVTALSLFHSRTKA
jgi:integrase